MGQVDAIRERLFSIFPGLKNDADFKLTSPATPDYNCISWAYSYSDRWMWPRSGETNCLDGVLYWPDGIIDSEDVTAFVEAFKLKGYNLCDSWEHEEGYRRIALYVEKGTSCTHASRELSTGKWTSKLGQLPDIQHGNPFSIEGIAYGRVYCIMKREHI